MIIQFSMFLLLALGLAFKPKDPGYSRQFHLFNNGSVAAGLAGEDINVQGAWDRSITGKGVKVVVLFDGCWPEHKEFGGRVDLNISWNFVTKKNDPTPSNMSMLQDKGNQLAGILGAESNDFCGVGVAPNVTIGCINAWEGMTMNSTYFLQGLMMYPDVDMKVVPSMKSCAQASSELIVCSGTPFVEAYEKALAEAKTTLVMSAEGIRTINDDLVANTFASSPHLFSFTELSQRGGAVTTAARGNVILASVVTGGSSYLSQYGVTGVHQTSSSGVGHDLCSYTVLVTGTGGAVAAGVIALIMEAGKYKLRRDDVASIIALTSVRNDPNSPTWSKNAAGVWYSRFFGFGRLDADAATKLASSWKEVPEATEKQTKNERKLLPTLLGPAVEYEIDFSKSEIKQVVFINVFVTDYGLQDWGLVRLWVVSPSGTKRLIKDVMSLTYSSGVGGGTWRVAARDFFAEDPRGIWKVILRREGIGPKEYGVDQVTVEIKGYTEAVCNVTEKTVGSDPYVPYPQESSGSLVVEGSDTIHCNNESLRLSLDSKVPGSWDVLVYEAQNGSRVERLGAIQGGQTTLIGVPCVWKTKQLKIRAENPGSGTSIVAKQNITIVNDNEYKFSAPSPYTVFKRQNGLVRIPLQVLRNTTHLSEFSLSQAMYVTIEDVENNIRLYVGTVPFTYTLTYTLPLNCNKCILSAAPFHTEAPGMCDTLVVPISIVDEGQPDPPEWELQWNNVCPVPDGVKVPQEQKPNKNKALVIGGSRSVVIVIAVIVIVVVMVLRRRRLRMDSSYQAIDKELLS